MPIVWFILGGTGALVFLVGLYRLARALRPVPRDEELPATPLERLGWVGLWVTALIGLGLGILVAINGATTFDEDVARITFWILLLIGMFTWFMFWRKLSRATGHAVIDERDRAIQARSFTVESVLVILSLVGWTIGLTEAFRDQGTIPIGYLQILFWSTFILGAFGRSLGIVLGYRQEPVADA